MNRQGAKAFLMRLFMRPPLLQRNFWGAALVAERKCQKKHFAAQLLLLLLFLLLVMRLALLLPLPV